MSTFTIQGRVTVIKDEQTFDSGFNKRAFVISDGADKYPQELEFETVKDKTELVAALNVGDLVDIGFNLRGRGWKEKHFINLEAWKITVLESASPEPRTEQAAKAAPEGDGFDLDDPLDEDVPF
jgi:hypothetical protein